MSSVRLQITRRPLALRHLRCPLGATVHHGYVSAACNIDRCAKKLLGHTRIVRAGVA